MQNDHAPKFHKAKVFAIDYSSSSIGDIFVYLFVTNVSVNVINANVLMWLIHRDCLKSIFVIYL